MTGFLAVSKWTVIVSGVLKYFTKCFQKNVGRPLFLNQELSDFISLCQTRTVFHVWTGLFLGYVKKITCT